MLSPPGSMDDGKRRTDPARSGEARVFPRRIAGPRAGSGYGNGSRMAATSAMAALRRARFRPASYPGPAREWPRSTTLYKGARGLQLIALTWQPRRADRDTSPLPDRSRLSQQRDRG